MKIPSLLSQASPPRGKVLLALAVGLLPLLASAQSTQHEFRRPVKTLTVSSSPATPTNPADPTPSGGTPALSLSTQAIDFGNVATNTTAKAQVLVSNTGDGTLSITRAATVSGASEFAAGLTTCGSTLAAGADCLLEPTFSPTTTGTFNGVLTFTTALAGSPHDITLVGTAFNPVSLASATLPTGSVGASYGPFDFKTLLAVSNEASPDKSSATWQLMSGSLPTGMTLQNGVLSGTPTAAASNSPLNVRVTYKSNQAATDYVLSVIAELFRYSQVAASGNLSCGVTVTGGVQCWGAAGTGGALGDGQVSVTVATPVDAVGLSAGATRIVTGSDHACAVVSGSVYCWGSDQYNRLGNGTAGNSSTPVLLTGISGTVTEMTAGLGHTCAATSTGSAYCWGTNGTPGRLGDGTTSDRVSPTLVQLAGGDVVTQLAASQVSTCALLSNGTVKCWGTGFTSVPTLEAGLSNITAISAVQNSGGTPYHCALSSAGDVYCWTTTGTVTQIAGISGASHVVAGKYKSCAIVGTAVKCWNPQNSTSAASLAAVSLTGLTAAPAQVVTGTSHLCVRQVDNKVRCSGTGTSGQLGQGSFTSVTFPATVQVGGGS